MFLIFRLGRPDVLPIHDLGVKKGWSITYGKKHMPKPKELLAFGERWRPYRTVASWYMWRAFERAGYKVTNKIRPRKPRKRKPANKPRHANNIDFCLCCCLCSDRLLRAVRELNASEVLNSQQAFDACYYVEWLTMLELPTRKSTRLPHLNYVGQKFYFTTTCCIDRKAIFLNPKLAHWLLALLRSESVAASFNVHAYGLMPSSPFPR